MENKNKDKVEDINISNIFEDFDSNIDIDSESEKNETKKDFIYYLNIIWNIFKYLNILFVFVLVFVLSYVWVQLSEDFKEKSYLDPICDLLLWENLNYDELSCSSVSSILWVYEDKLNTKKEDILVKLIPLVQDLYIIEDFKNSKKVNFLLDKSESRDNPILIVKDFDFLKNDFTILDKAQIRCSNIKVSENLLEADCSAFSSLWDSWIPWFNWEKTEANSIWWTSVSLASSFLNYIDLSDNFDVVDMQKVFTYTKVVWEGNFTYKTDFKLKAQYKESTNLLF